MVFFAPVLEHLLPHAGASSEAATLAQQRRAARRSFELNRGNPLAGPGAENPSGLNSAENSVCDPSGDRILDSIAHAALDGRELMRKARGTPRPRGPCGARAGDPEGTRGHHLGAWGGGAGLGPGIRGSVAVPPPHEEPGSSRCRRAERRRSRRPRGTIRPSKEIAARVNCLSCSPSITSTTRAPAGKT
jgi:hypothetical protein